MSLDQIEREKLELLDGSRAPGSKGRAAVRRGDLSAIVTLAPMKAAKAAGTTVSADEFNALLADFAALRAAIDQIAGRVK
jgi:hypothetical protein